MNAIDSDFPGNAVTGGNIYMGTIDQLHYNLSEIREELALLNVQMSRFAKL